MRRWLVGSLAAVLMALAPVAWGPVAFAQGPEAERKARDLFNAGVEAYKQGQFVAAAQAFTQAHELLPKPQLLFSIAQAFRRSFDATQDKDHLVQAVKYYRQYLEAVPEGGRRLEATRALGDLRPWMDRMQVDVNAAGEMTFPTRLSVRSPVEGAVVVIDGGPVYALPYTAEIEPGPHRLEAHAEGYRSEVREFAAGEEETVPFDIQFEGVEPTLEVAEADGAEVTVDGKLLGEAPFSQPLGVSRGRHYVTVTARGHEAYAAELDFDYGSQTRLEVDLPATNQRRAAWVVLGTGGAGLVASGVLFGLAIAEESEATEIRDQQAAGTITIEQRDAYNRALDRRDDLRVAAAITAGAGAAVAITGLFLYLFDEPVVPPPTRSAPEPEDETRQEDEPAVEMEMMGALAPGMYGLGLFGRF